MFASQTRDLPHIELARSDNISNLNAVKAYRVGEAHISTEEKNKSKNGRFYPFILALFCLYRGLGLAHKVSDRTNAMLAFSRFSN